MSTLREMKTDTRKIQSFQTSFGRRNGRSTQLNTGQFRRMKANVKEAEMQDRLTFRRNSVHSVTCAAVMDLNRRRLGDAREDENDRPTVLKLSLSAAEYSFKCTTYQLATPCCETDYLARARRDAA